LEADSIEKVMEIDVNLGCAVSGMTADARTMIEHARVAAQVKKKKKALPLIRLMYSLALYVTEPSVCL
jgi:20S proteasome alpha/beta subunit